MINNNNNNNTTMIHLSGTANKDGDTKYVQTEVIYYPDVSRNLK